MVFESFEEPHSCSLSQIRSCSSSVYTLRAFSANVYVTNMGTVAAQNLAVLSTLCMGVRGGSTARAVVDAAAAEEGARRIPCRSPCFLGATTTLGSLLEAVVVGTLTEVAPLCCPGPTLPRAKLRGLCMVVVTVSFSRYSLSSLSLSRLPLSLSSFPFVLLRFALRRLRRLPPFVSSAFLFLFFFSSAFLFFRIKRFAKRVAGRFSKKKKTQIAFIR